MAASIDSHISFLGGFSPNYNGLVHKAKIFVVGAGGIGCELLKNLVLVGFKDIHVIDLDTIDVSNLNRQFLFRKEHVGKSKAQIAKQSVLSYNRDVNVTAYHDSIFNTDFGVEFFKKFDVVLNALDNRAARNHVNRMCLAARVPLIDSGTAGYLGQVQVINRGETECYECQPKPTQKTFPGCTIRNTPSEPIHCIVWAKHLFNQLFGEEDPDQDVSPDTEDPELAADAGKSALESEAKDGVVGGITRKSTRTWAEESGYNPEKIFNKLFRDDIHYLLSMENLWKKREPPVPLDYSFEKMSISQENGHSNSGSSETMQRAGISDQRIWSLMECRDVFSLSLQALRKAKEATSDGTLVWDKDDTASLDFVVATANLRMGIFNITRKSKFDIKSMAGNIIPAIATTNAIIAGIQVMECIRIISGGLSKCHCVYLARNQRMILNPCRLTKPNPKCYVCSEKPEVILQVNPSTMTLQTLSDKVLKLDLGMQSPDIELDDGKGTILLTCEEGVTDGNETKYLSEFNITEGSRLKCDDFLQEYNLVIIINSVQSLEDGKQYNIVVDRSTLNAKPEQSKPSKPESDDEDDMEVIEHPPSNSKITAGVKRSGSDSIESPSANKKAKISAEEDVS